MLTIESAMTPTATPNTRSAPARTLRSALVALIAEFLILALPLNFVYGYVAHNAYRMSLVAGLMFALVAVVFACSGYAVYARYVARREPSELTLSRMVDLPRGWLLGAALIGVVVATFAAAGDLNLSAGGWPALAGLPAIPLLAGVFEELIARGVVFRNLENLFGSEIAIALSAALFGWLHLGNPNATVLSATAVGLEGGVMLAALYVVTRSLWWTIGVHMAWNFTQTSVFGIADSGNPGRGLLHAELSGPAWLTGGAFGVEASVVSVVVCAAVSAGLLLRAYRSRRMVAPLWELRRR